MRSAGEIENQKGPCYGICLNMLSTSSRVGGMKMTKMMNQVDLLGSGDTVGSGIQRIMVSAHMIFILETSEAGVDLSFAQVMKMNRKRCFAMLSVGNRHFIGLLILMIFVREITDVLIQKVPDVGVMRQMMRMKHPHRRRYLWHGRHLD